MAKFICLTQSVNADTTKPLIVNADHIQHIVVGHKGKDVHVRMSDGTFFFVRDTFAEIQKMLAGVPTLAGLQQLRELA